jgi:hypothetical protein
MYWHITKPSDFTEALTSPSIARNRDPILSVLRRVLPPTGQVLEIASGTGEHAVHFAAALPHLTWQPTDREEQALRSIAAHRAVAGLPNLLVPLVLDAAAPEWLVEQPDAIVAINMVHISPWRATQVLMAGAGGIVPPGGVLFLYGAYKENGAHTASSNEAFDLDLRRRNPDGDLRIRWRGVDLPFRSFFDKLQTVEPGAIVDNKRLGSVLEWFKEWQTAYGPAWNSSHPKRRRTANNLRPEPSWA